MTKEIELLKQEIKVLEKKLSFLEELEKQKLLPKMKLNQTGVIDDLEYNGLRYFRIDYGNNYVVWWEQTEKHHAKMQMVVDKETREHLEFDYNNLVKSKPAEEVFDRLEDKYEDVCKEEETFPVDWYDDVKWTEKNTPIITDEVVNSLIEKWKENPPDFLKFELGKTLEELITDWWWDVHGGINSHWSVDSCVADLCERVSNWLPAEQNSEGTQRIKTEIAVDTHNELLRKIKSKLRNKN